MVAILPGCMGARQIQTSTPRTFNTPESSEARAAGMSLLSVEIATGVTELPADVQALRFRVDEIRLQNSEGEWQVFPSELNSFEVLPGRNLSKTILTTRVLPVAYDSLTLRISDVFVLFGDNAGSSLTLSRDGLSRQGLEMQAELGIPTRLRIVFEPGASLARDPDCRWHFVPFWTIRRE